MAQPTTHPSIPQTAPASTLDPTTMTEATSSPPPDQQSQPSNWSKQIAPFRTHIFATTLVATFAALFGNFVLMGSLDLSQLHPALSVLHESSVFAYMQFVCNISIVVCMNSLERIRLREEARRKGERSDLEEQEGDVVEEKEVVLSEKEVLQRLDGQGSVSRQEHLVRGPAEIKTKKAMDVVAVVFCGAAGVCAGAGGLVGLASIGFAVVVCWIVSVLAWVGAFSR